MDLMSGAGGPRADARGHIFGGRTLHVRENLSTPEDLVDLSQAAINDYREHHYEDDFSFIDDYVYIDDDVLITRLRAEVLADILSGRDNVDAFVPDDLTGLEDERAIQYILFPGEQRRSASRTTLTAPLVSAKLAGADESALDWTLRFVDSEHDVIAEATVLECLAADLSLDSGRYLLSDGSFYRVNPQFLERIDGELSRVSTTSMDLPCYRGGVEGDWNSAVAAQRPKEFVCLDGDFVRLTGQTPFEAADLVHISGLLVHAKRKGRSSAPSYVFVQARRSCQFLSQVPAAGQQLREKVAAAATTKSVREQMTKSLMALESRPAGLEVAIALLGDWRNRGLENLPLLAKVELVETMRDIELLGFRPSIALVGLCDVSYKRRSALRPGR